MVWIISDDISTHTPLQALSGSLIGITTITVLLRLHARRVQEVRLGIDDWMMVLAYLAFLTMNICVLYFIAIHRIGWPVAQTVTDHETIKSQDIVIYINSVFVAICLGCVKLSALFFYKRIFCVPGRLHTVINVAIGITVLWTIAFIIFPALRCGVHPEALYSSDPKIHSQYCTKLHQVLLSSSLTDLILEFCIVVLPIPTILTMRTTLRRRIGVTLIFLTAFASVGASAGRLTIIASLYLGGPIANVRAADAATYFTWLFEGGFAIVAVNLPSLWFLRNKIVPKSVLSSIRGALSRSPSVRSVGSAELRKSRFAAPIVVDTCGSSDVESGDFDDRTAHGSASVPEAYGQYSSKVVSDARRLTDEEQAQCGLTMSKQAVSVSETQLSDQHSTR